MEAAATGVNIQRTFRMARKQVLHCTAGRTQHSPECTSRDDNDYPHCGSVLVLKFGRVSAAYPALSGVLSSATLRCTHPLASPDLPVPFAECIRRRPRPGLSCLAQHARLLSVYDASGERDPEHAPSVRPGKVQAAAFSTFRWAHSRPTCVVSGQNNEASADTDHLLSKSQISHHNPSPECDNRPYGFDQTKRPCALQKPVS